MGMKAHWLGTSALASVLLLSAHGARADESTGNPASPFKLTIGGYFEAYMVANNEQNGVVNGEPQPGYGYKTLGVFRRSRLQFNLEAQVSQSVSVGAEVRLRGESNPYDQIEESFGHIDTGFGRLEIGKTASAPNKMYYGAPTPVPGFGANSPDFMPAHLPSSNAANSPVSFISWGPGYVYDRAEKVTYFTPRMKGFQFGVSYTPNPCMIGNVPTTASTAPYYCQIGTSFPSGNYPGAQSNVVEIGANYVRKFGEDNIFQAYVGGGWSKLEAQSFANNNMRGQKQVGGGAQMTWGNWTIGADFRWNNLGVKYGWIDATGDGPSATTQWDWEVGLLYTFDKLMVGFQYHDTRATMTTPGGAGAGEDRLRMLTVGGTYLLGPGIQLAAGVQPFKIGAYNGDPAAQNKGVSYMLGTKLTF